MILDTTYVSNPREGLRDLRTDLDSPETLVLVFSGLDRSEMEVPVKSILADFPQAIVVGCSTAGEVFDATVRDGGITVAAARFERATLTTACSSILEAGASFAGGVDLARQLRSESLKAVIVFSDGLQVNGSELLHGLRSGIAESVIVTGGLAGDADRFAETWVLAEGRARSGVVAAVGLHGDAVHVGHGSRGGWDIFGPERRVTRAEGNVVFELDGRSVLDLYEEYLGDLAGGLPGSGLFFPLAIKKHSDDEEALVRTLLSVNREDRSLTFAGDIPTGWTAQLMRANYDRLIAGAAGAASETYSRSAVSDVCLGIAISCVGRRLVLKDRVEEELEAAVHGLPAGTQLVGFYSYGELSPLASGRCELHNQTMTLTTVSERLD